MPKVLLHFIEMLGQHNYLALPQGNTIINYIIKLSVCDPSVSRGWGKEGTEGGSSPPGREQEKGRVGSRRERRGYTWHMGRAFGL